VLAQLAGAVVEGVLHAAIDDGRLLRRFAQATNKMRFHDLADHGVTAGCCSTFSGVAGQ
jgi:hypothetical protein